MGALDGKVAVITGVANGIGRGVALAFGREGAAVIGNDVDAKGAKSTVDEIIEAGGLATSIAAPVGDDRTAKLLVDTAVETYGRLDAMVNIAGVYAPGPVVDMTPAMFDRVLRVHLYGTFFNAQAAIRHMVTSGGGRIINTTSRAGLRGFPPGEPNYSAAKAGIVGLSLALAYELLVHRITVNCVSPVAWTRTAEALPEDERQRSWDMRSKGVLGRPGMPADVAEAYVFLASDRAGYLTGQVIEATGEPIHLL